MRLELIRHFCQQFLRLSCLPIPALSHIARLSEPPIGKRVSKTDINLQCASQQSHYHPLFLLQLRYLAKISPTLGNCGELTALRCPIAVCSLLLYLIQRFIVLCKTLFKGRITVGSEAPSGSVPRLRSHIGNDMLVPQPLRQLCCHTAS